MRLLLGSGVDLFTQMPLTSEALKRLIPSFSLSMIRVDERCAPQTHYSEHFDEFSHDLFASAGHVFAAASDDPAAFGTLLRHPKPFGTLIDGRPEFINGATYQHLFKRNGIHHVLDVALRDDAGPLGILGIFREQDARPFTSADVARVADFYPWLVHALRAETRPSRFDEVDSAMLVATPSGHIEFATSLAREWLGDAIGSDERTLLLRGDLLPEAIRALCARCQTMQSLRPGRGHALTPPTLTLRVAGGRVRLRAYPLAGHGGAARFGVQLSLELDRRVRLLRALEEAALPPKLRQLALASWDGAEPEALPEVLGVTPATLKSYRKELYLRLDVNSSRALVERLDAMALAVRFDLRRHHPRRA
ncbi:MAG: hypothetical protein ACO1OB_23900 [Archangium sp.]